ncbi:hypothetical protein CYMTET_56917 [Cymbomonas tetramitiformis]|uniref:Uncharacterized protein n=1 Tax=Cymbomonas tetramitiformis TaxID=36881 RepID=A0AAE0EM34_9CHLO|nr:hypothetical protein CYMTET_56917 [Cymbomonas tetramitiformis]
MAREALYKDCCKRWFNDMLDCELEDFVVATLLDPQHKNFQFKFAERWMRGRFTANQAVSWATNIYEKDLKPKEVACTKPPTKNVYYPTLGWVNTT